MNLKHLQLVQKSFKQKNLQEQAQIIKKAERNGDKRKIREFPLVPTFCSLSPARLFSKFSGKTANEKHFLVFYWNLKVGIFILPYPYRFQVPPLRKVVILRSYRWVLMKFRRDTWRLLKKFWKAVQFLEEYRSTSEFKYLQESEST